MGLKAGIQLSVDGKGNLKVIDLVRGDVRKLNAETKRSTKELRKMRMQSQDNAKSLQVMGAKAKFAGGALLAAFGVGSVVSDILRTGNAVNGLESSLTATFGTLENGRGQLDFVREEANRLGLEYLTLAKNYSQWAAGAEKSNLAGEAQREIFTSVAETARVLNLTVDDTNGIFRALTQVMSKGKVQAEELRGQMGERIPGAFAIAADAMNVTQAELNKMLADGEVYSDEFLPKFAAELKKTYGGGLAEATNNLQANTNRIKNSFSQLQEITFGAVESSLTSLTKSTAYALDSINESLSRGEFEGNLKHWSDAIGNVKKVFNDFLNTSFGASSDKLISDFFGGVKELFLNLPVYVTEAATMIIAEVSYGIDYIYENYKILDLKLGKVWLGVGNAGAMGFAVIKTAALEARDFVSQVIGNLLADAAVALQGLPNVGEGISKKLFDASGSITSSAKKALFDGKKEIAATQAAYAKNLGVSDKAIAEHNQALSDSKLIRDIIIRQSKERIAGATAEREAEIKLNRAIVDSTNNRVLAGGVDGSQDNNSSAARKPFVNPGKASGKGKGKKLTEAQKTEKKRLAGIAKEQDRLNKIILDSEAAYKRARIQYDQGTLSAEAYDFVVKGISKSKADELALLDQNTKKLNDEFEARENLRESADKLLAQLKQEFAQYGLTGEALIKAQLAAEGYDATQIKVLTTQKLLNEAKKKHEELLEKSSEVYKSALEDAEDYYNQLIKTPDAYRMWQLAQEGVIGKNAEEILSREKLNEGIAKQQNFYAELYDSAVQSGDGIKGVWKSIGDAVVNQFKRMAKEKLLSGIFGGKTASGGRGGGLIGSILGTIGIPGFASGGDHSGGLRIVGERGAELEATGASRIYSASQTREILKGGSGASGAPVINFSLVTNSGKEGIEQKENSDGSFDVALYLDKRIDSVTASNILNPSSQTHKANKAVNGG